MGNALAIVTPLSRVAVHPHVHGERTQRGRVNAHWCGSSPRTWGTPLNVAYQTLDMRFIPTYMGNARDRYRRPTRTAVHPHVHGERGTIPIDLWIILGSSPRTWGTRNVPALLTYGFRFIPTYMGNAPRHLRSPLSPTVHPHVHGERPRQSRSRRSAPGSSPRTWGTPQTFCHFIWCVWFIPTYMGNARKFRASSQAVAVHPHVHGERCMQAWQIQCPAGSSPRTWGTLILSLMLSGCWRFIPTYMGNASVSWIVELWLPVHPHVHGERRGTNEFPNSSIGSSPRTWGTQMAGDPIRAAYRFIPTYMGNAPPLALPCLDSAVHPHVHGERNRHLDGASEFVGSSPRTWGTPEVTLSRRTLYRFIPTYMGNA